MSEISDLIQQMEDLIGQLDISLAQEAPGSLQDRLLAFQKVQVLAKDLKTLEGFLEAGVLASMEGKTQEVAGYQLTKRSSSNRTTWDHEGLYKELKRVADKERLDHQTGEIKESHVDAFIGLLTEAASVNYWRVTALKAHNIYVADYREVEYGRERLQVELAPSRSDEQPVQG